MTGRVIPFRARPLSSEAGIAAAAERVLATPLEERAAEAARLHLEDPGDAAGALRLCCESG